MYLQRSSGPAISIGRHPESEKIQPGRCRRESAPPGERPGLLEVAATFVRIRRSKGGWFAYHLQSTAAPDTANYLVAYPRAGWGRGVEGADEPLPDRGQDTSYDKPW